MDDSIQTVSGLLSPRRIEAIHIAFNGVFDNAVKSGVIRDASTYRSFDEIFEIAMRRREGLEVEEEMWVGEDDKRGVEREMHLEEQDVEGEDIEGEMADVEVLEVVREDGVLPVRERPRVEVIINSQDTTRDVLFSDEDQTIIKPAKRKPKRPWKRTIEQIDGTLHHDKINQ
jgi:hypothetical protein